MSDREDRPLSTVGMPYYREQLLSSWPSHMVSEIGAPPPKFTSQFMQTLKNGPFGYTGPNPKGTRRNQVENTRNLDKPIPTLQAPKFLSEMAREAADEKTGMERKLSDVADTISAAERSSLKADVPVMYRNVEIKYSKFGVDDFDFGQVILLCEVTSSNNTPASSTQHLILDLRFIFRTLTPTRFFRCCTSHPSFETWHCTMLQDHVLENSVSCVRWAIYLICLKKRKGSYVRPRIC